MASNKENIQRDKTMYRKLSEYVDKRHISSERIGPLFRLQQIFGKGVNKKFLYKTGRLQSRFQKLGLQSSEPRPVTPALYQACLTYTLLAKLAPTWNKAGQWLLQGRDFLSATACQNAIKMSLTVTSNDSSLALQASALRSTHCQLDDLNVNPSAQKQFREDPEGVIPETYIINSWCHVLPSMKKGKIVAVHKTIPEDSPFKTYRDFKRHWKNTYGYRLPDSEDNMLYYQIYFKPIGHTLFTYPELCLRPREFHFLPRVDPKPILASFLQDIAAKLPAVCGQSLSFQPKAKYAKPGLSNASENLTNANLTSRIPRSNAQLRDPAMLGHLFKDRNLQNIRTPLPDKSFPKQNADTAPSDSPSIKSMNSHFNEPEIRNSHGKIVPLFKSKSISRHVNGRVEPPAKKITPVFKQRSNVTANITPNLERDKDVTPLKLPFMVQGETVSRIPPTTTTEANPSSQILRVNAPPVCRPLFERKISISTHSESRLNLPRPVPSFLPILGNLHDEDFQLPTVSTPVFSSAKRKLETQPTTVGSPVVKKVRSKPQVQTGVDVETAARQNQLGKVNAATLLAWLKERNVPCKAKDKKTDLVDRVNSFLCIANAEP